MSQEIEMTGLMADSMDDLIQVRNLSFSISGRNILNQVSCRFPSGRIHGVIGPNGSGKSTFLRCLCRIWKPQQGKILIAGQEQKTISRRNLSKILTLVPQFQPVDFPVSVFDFVAMGRHPHLRQWQGLGENDVRSVTEALKVTGTNKFGHRQVNQLSGGEQQLVSIARALATGAPIILLDEPTSALDIAHKLEIMDLMNDLIDQGKTIILSLHDLNLARSYCHTLTMLKKGRVRFSGPTLTIFTNDKIKEIFNIYVEEAVTPKGISLLFHK